MTGAALTLVSYFVDLGQLGSVLKQVQPSLVLALALVSVLLVAVTVPRMMLILHQLNAVRLRPLFLLRVNFFTAIVGYMVPFSVLADSARAAVLWAETPVSPALALEVSVQDRVLALLGLVLAGLVLTPFQPHQAGASIDVVTVQNFFYWAAVAAIFTMALAGGVLRRRVNRPWGAQAHSLISRLLGNIVRLEFLVPQILLAVISNLLYALTFWLAMRAIGVVDVPYWILLTVTPALSISQNIPFFYLGWGSREAAAVVLLSVVAGIAPDQAIAASLLVGAGNFLAALPGLLFFAHFTRVRRSEKNPRVPHSKNP